MFRNLLQKQRPFGRSRRLASLIIMLLMVMSFGTVIDAQQTQQSDPEVDRLQQQYDQLVIDLRKSMKNTSEADIRFRLSDQDESSQHRETWRQEVQKTNQVLAELKPVAIRLFEKLREPPPELTYFVMRLATDLFDRGMYTDANRLAQRILEIFPDNGRMIFLRGRCSAYLNDFEGANKFAIEHPALLESLTDSEKYFFTGIDFDLAIERYEQELATRKKEAEADDLPRVELKTSKGTIVVELFENEAPDTVGNFIYLVEQRHFDEKVFHRVINHFMAQTGLFTSNGVQSPVDYTIYDECGQPNARSHFRGVLSMAKMKDPNTGGGQFFITFVPTLHLDGVHTVFGRVISGWSALDQINRTIQQNAEGQDEAIPGVRPDKIISARVLRKRDHEYLPDKVEFEE